MDSNGFRKGTNPNYYHSVPRPVVKAAAYKETQQPNITGPAPNARYSGLAYTGVADANLFTDYLPQCSKNVSPEVQNPTRLFLQKNANEIIRISRQRQADSVGAGIPHAQTIPPSESIVSCDPFQCKVVKNNSDGIGRERGDSPAPELFGTFSIASSWSSRPASLIGSATTTKYEGGRNSRR